MGKSSMWKQQLLKMSEDPNIYYIVQIFADECAQSAENVNEVLSVARSFRNTAVRKIRDCKARQEFNNTAPVKGSIKYWEKVVASWNYLINTLQGDQNTPETIPDRKGVN